MAKNTNKAKYKVIRGFCYTQEIGTRVKGQILELSGDELEFAKAQSCVVELKE